MRFDLVQTVGAPGEMALDLRDGEFLDRLLLKYPRFCLGKDDLVYIGGGDDTGPVLVVDGRFVQKDGKGIGLLAG